MKINIFKITIFLLVLTTLYVATPKTVFADVCGQESVTCCNYQQTCTDPLDPDTCTTPCVGSGGSKSCTNGINVCNSPCGGYDSQQGACGDPIILDCYGSTCHERFGACGAGCSTGYALSTTWCDGGGDGIYSSCGSNGCKVQASCASSGGYGCVNPASDACSWTSGGTYSVKSTCDAACNPDTPPPPTPPPVTCGDTNVCNADQQCCWSASPFCYDPNVVPSLCGTFVGACDASGTSSWCNASGSGGGGYAAVPGAANTGCNSEMLVYKSVDGNIVLKSVKTDGTPCAYHAWGGPQHSGLAVWHALAALNEALKPNYPNAVTKSLAGNIPNSASSITLSGATYSPDTPQNFIINPACVTNAGDGVNYYQDYVLNSSDPFNPDHISEQRWSSMNACHRTVSYTPVTCSISASAGTVNLGENLTIDILGGSKLPVKIDGGGNSVGYAVRLFVERSDFAEISPLPASLTQTNGQQPGNRFYYQLGTDNDCRFSSATGTCSTSVALSDLPAGSYNFHCDIPRVPYGNPSLNNSFEPQNCTGDPWCSFEGGDPANTCDGWFSCSDGDNVNVVVTEGIPDAPTGLTSSCSAADKLTLNWSPVADATSYLVRVDDGDPDVDNIDSTLYAPGADVCAGYDNWDVCITVLGTSTNVKILNPATFTTATWRIYAVNSAGQSLPSQDATLRSCIPNCRDIEGPPSVRQGDTALYSAVFESAYGWLGGNLSIKKVNDASIATYLKWDGWVTPKYSRDFGATTKIIGDTNRALTVFSWDTTGFPVGTYNLYCRAWNDGKAECQGDSTTTHTPPIYTCAGGISSMEVEVLPPRHRVVGTVYDGKGVNPTGTVCSADPDSPTPVAWSGANTMSVTVSGVSPTPDPTATTNVSDVGSYQTGLIEAGSGTEAKVTLGNLPFGYRFSCPGSGIYSYNTEGQTTANITRDFFITQSVDAWWETIGGLAYGKDLIKSTLPLDSSGNPGLCPPIGSPDHYKCAPYLMRSPTFNLPGLQGGLALSRSFSGVSGWESERSQNQFGQLPASETNVNALKKKGTSVYDYYLSRIPSEKLTTIVTADLPTPSVLTKLEQLSAVDKPMYFFFDDDLTISPGSMTEMTVPAIGKYILFVDGSLTIGSDTFNPANDPSLPKIINVQSGGFLAIFVKGPITIRPTVGRAFTTGTPSAASGVGNGSPSNLDGIYVADGIITIETNNPSNEADIVPDKRFIGAGSFVSAQKIEMKRSYNRDGVGLEYSKTLSGYTPSEVFRHRPDIVLATPDELKEALLQFEEIR